MPKKTVKEERALRTGVPRVAKALLAFVNFDAGREMAGDEAAVRTELRDWLSRLGDGQQLPPHVVHPPYVLAMGSVGGDARSAADWFKYRRDLEWLATDGLRLLRQCPRCRTFFLVAATVAEQNWREVSDRFIEHLQACGHSLPDVLSELTVSRTRSDRPHLHRA